MYIEKLPKYYTTLNTLKSTLSRLEFAYLLERLNKVESDSNPLALRTILELCGLDIALKSALGEHVSHQEELEFLLFSVECLKKFAEHKPLPDTISTVYFKTLRLLNLLCEGKITKDELEVTIYSIKDSDWSNNDLMYNLKFLCFSDLSFAIDCIVTYSRKYPMDVRPWIFNRFKDLLEGYYTDKVNTEGVYSRIYKNLNSKDKI